MIRHELENKAVALSKGCTLMLLFSGSIYEFTGMSRHALFSIQITWKIESAMSDVVGALHFKVVNRGFTLGKWSIKHQSSHTTCNIKDWVSAFPIEHTSKTNF